MALKRSPTSIVVNGAYLRVKDPQASPGDLFADYVTVPGLGSWTMPAETGSVTETAIMDGSIAAPQFKGVGTITGAMPALGAHVSHQFLEQRSIDQRDIQVEIVKHAVAVTSIDLGGAAGNVVDARAADAGTPNRSDIAISKASDQLTVKQSVLWGHILAMSAEAATAAELASVTGASPVLAYTSKGADGTQWRGIVTVAADGSMIRVAPAFVAAITTANNKFRRINVRNPGKRWTDVLVKVNQYDQGDFQSGSNVGSNFTFTPSTTVQAAIVEHRLDSDAAGEHNVEQ